jgi:hypothetical protein
MRELAGQAMAQGHGGGSYFAMFETFEKPGGASTRKSGRTFGTSVLRSPGRRPDRAGRECGLMPAAVHAAARSVRANHHSVVSIRLRALR